MAAEELGIPVEQVRPVVADTETVGYNDLTGGSRVTFATGMAVIEAARDVVKQLRARAAQTWSVELDVGRLGGRPRRAGERRRGQARAALAARSSPARAGATGGPISGRASLTARGAGPGFATHLCDVEVDRETGAVKVLRYTAIQDAGKADPPELRRGPDAGRRGAGHRLGAERGVRLRRERARCRTRASSTTACPVASDLPMIDTVIVEVPNPMHPYGVRGVGETPIVPPLAAVANAVQRAAGVRDPRAADLAARSCSSCSSARASVARVVFAAGLRRFTGGAESLEIDARDVRELLAELDKRFPPLGDAARARAPRSRSTARSCRATKRCSSRSAPTARSTSCRRSAAAAELRGGWPPHPLGRPA